MAKYMKRKTLPLTAFLLGITVLLMAPSVSLAATGEEYEGTAGIFGLDTGGRPAGMGGAFTALADDENAAYYNPAALAFLEDAGVTSAWSPRFGLLNYGSVGVAGKYFGANVSLLSSGTLQVPNVFSVPTDESFIYLSSGGVASFGYPLGSNFSLGGRLKYYYSHVSTESSSDGFGWAVDPALLVRVQGFRLGVLFENALSSGIVYGSSHTEELARKVRAGVSMGLPVREAAEVNLVVEGEGRLEALLGGAVSELTPHLGIEFWFNALGIRAGYNGRGATIGASVDVNVLRLDWAYVAYQEDIEGSHNVSLVFRF